MAGKSPEPSHEPSFQAPVTLMKQLKEKIRDGRWGGDAKVSTPQTAAQMLYEDPSSVQSYHIPCEPALMALTAGCPLINKLVDCLTAKLVDRLTAKLVDRLW